MVQIRIKKWDLISAGILVGLVLLWFGKIILSGKLLFGMDFVFQFYPWKKFIYDHLWTQGALPFWNPYLFSGVPFITNIQASMFYPLGFFYYTLSPEIAYQYSTILHCMLGSIFMYAFMRTVSVSPVGSLVSAVIFIFNGFFMGHLYAGHLTFVQTFIWIPLIFLFLYRFIQSWDFKNAVITGLLLGVQILGGFPQIAFYTIFGILIFCLFHGAFYLKHQGRSDAGRLCIGFLVILILGFSLAAIQILPTVEFTKLSTRAGGVSYDFATYESLHPKELLAFIFPDIFGNAVDQTYWRSRESWHFWESCGYVGILPLFLIFIRVDNHSTRRLRMFFLLLVVLSLFLALGKHNPLYPLIYKLPGFNSFRIPAQIIFLYVFGIAVVSGMGIKELQDDGWRTNKGFIPFLSLTGLLCLFLLIGLLLFPYPLFFHLFRNLAEGPVTHADLTGLYGRISSSIYQGALIFVAASLLFFVLKRKRIYPWILNLLFPGLVIVDLFLFGADFIQPYQYITSLEKKRVVEELMGSPAKGRIVTLSNAFGANDGLQYGFPSILGYDPLILKRYVHYVLSGQGQIPVDHVVNLGGIKNPNEKLLRLLHLKKEVYEKEIVSLENKIPYAHIVSQAVIKPTEEIVPFMKSNAFDPLKMVVIEPQYQSKLFSPIEGGVSEGSCTIIEYQNESIIIRASTKKPGYLVLSEIFYPGWRATVDGEKATILPGNFLFRVIPLNEGVHEVHLFFISWPFRIGILISLLTLTGSIWFIFQHRRR